MHCSNNRHPCDNTDTTDDTGAAEEMLYVTQTAEQRRLMAMYGNYMTFLDATYKVCKYDLPLYFIVVKTNSDYQVVGSFIIQSETSVSISEALAIIKDWNPSWQPSVWMMDNCAAENKAIETAFKGKLFHRAVPIR